MIVGYRCDQLTKQMHVALIKCVSCSYITASDNPIVFVLHVLVVSLS